MYYIVLYCICIGIDIGIVMYCIVWYCIGIVFQILNKLEIFRNSEVLRKESLRRERELQREKAAAANANVEITRSPELTTEMDTGPDAVGTGYSGSVDRKRRRPQVDYQALNEELISRPAATGSN